ncbi:MAG: hypothetical protein WAU36_04300 [Cyclobacteriaceae bacterium]
MSKKKNANLAALLSEDSGSIEQQVTGRKQEGSNEPVKQPVKEPVIRASDEEHDNGATSDEFINAGSDELKMALEEELDLPKSFTRVFKKNSRYEKQPKTTTLVYRLILEKYSKASSAMDVDTVVLVNNVLAEWYNKHLEPFDKVVNRKEPVKAL